MREEVWRVWGKVREIVVCGRCGRVYGVSVENVGKNVGV